MLFRIAAETDQGVRFQEYLLLGLVREHALVLAQPFHRPATHYRWLRLGADDLIRDDIVEHTAKGIALIAARWWNIVTLSGDLDPDWPKHIEHGMLIAIQAEGLQAAMQLGLVLNQAFEYPRLRQPLQSSLGYTERTEAFGAEDAAGGKQVQDAPGLRREMPADKNAARSVLAWCGLLRTKSSAVLRLLADGRPGLKRGKLGAG